MEKDPNITSIVVTAICEMCGRMQIEEKYYDPDGNAATKFITCDICESTKQHKQQKKKK